jgi:hypothetical protein
MKRAAVLIGALALAGCAGPHAPDSRPPAVAQAASCPADRTLPKRGVVVATRICGGKHWLKVGGKWSTVTERTYFRCFKADPWPECKG